MYSNLSTLAWSIAAGWLYTSITCAASFKLTPVLLQDTWKHVKENEQPGWHSSVCGLVHACILPFFAFTGFAAIGHAAADCTAAINITNVPASTNTVIATGMTTGYFFFDFCNLVWNKKKLLASSMKNEYYVMLWHHILSVLIWPYAVASSLHCWWINYFLVTEVTNIGLNVRSILMNFETLRNSSMVLNISIVWVVAFFIIRVLPVPFLVQYYVSMVLPGCHLNRHGMLPEWLHYGVSITSIPIPVILNCYWFSLMIKMAMKKLFPKKKAEK